jgi:hypothetical protein
MGIFFSRSQIPVELPNFLLPFLKFHSSDASSGSPVAFYALILCQCTSASMPLFIFHNNHKKRKDTKMQNHRKIDPGRIELPHSARVRIKIRPLRILLFRK